jgi:hypothetical protein
MIVPNLTKPARPAHTPRMREERGTLVRAMMVMMGSALAAGCISVNAPNEPIVIELNINISQEVIYKLAGDVQQNIEENPEIF